MSPTLTIPAAAAAGFEAAWTKHDVARYLGVSVRHVEHLMTVGHRSYDAAFPQPRRLGRILRWAPETIREYLAAPAEEAAAAVRRPTRRRSSQRVL